MTALDQPSAERDETSGATKAERNGVTTETLYASVFALFGWLVGTGPLSDNSFLWHLRTGELILEHGIPRTDPFSFTAGDASWVAQSWLMETLYAFLNGLGPWTIRAMTGVFAALFSVIVFLLASRLSGSPLRAALIAFPALFCAAIVWSERPLMAGVVLFALLVVTVELPSQWLGRHAVWILPPLIWLWANLHGSWSLGLVYLGVHLVGQWLDGSPPTRGPERSLMFGAVLAVLLIPLNPYGFELLFFPLELLARGDVLAHVAEWKSPTARTLVGMAFFGWTAIVICSIARGRVRAPRRDLLMTVVFVGLAFWALRNVLILPLVTVPVVARTWRREDTSPSSASYPAAALAVLGVVAVLVGVARLTSPAYDFSSYPVTAFDALEERALVGRRLLTNDRWGGYSIWRWNDEQPVFFDDRFDMYPVPVSEDYIALKRGTSDWEARLDVYDVEVVVWPSDEMLSEQLAASPRWQQIETDDDTASVFIRH